MNNLKTVSVGLGLALTLGACSAPQRTLPDALSNAPTLSAQAVGGLEAGRRVSLRVVTPGFDNRFIRHANSLGFTEVVNAGSGDTLRSDASWDVVAGLADSSCFSFKSVNVGGQYLRHFNSRLRIDVLKSNDDLFKNDATFCAVAGLNGQAGTLSLASKNYPGRYLRHRNGELWLDTLSDNSFFKNDATWAVAAPFKAAGTVTPPQPPPGEADLSEPGKKDIAMQLVSSAENSTLNWRAKFGYIEDIGDGRGYTGGIIGFTSGTSDMLELVQRYTNNVPGNVLAKYLPALRRVDGSASHSGLDPNYTTDWRTAASDQRFQQEQESERDRVYFNPSVQDAKADGLRALGQFAYYDAAVVHGYDGMRSVRRRALARAKSPSQGGEEVAYLNAFLDERVIEMQKEAAHEDTTRIDTAQRVFLRAGNLDLNTPLNWKVYGDSFSIR
ncbi:chitosanase [Deinococcus sp.]|uniref:chitosanase n=1 Tax=Deinococcus sp. TaxID=47478 RepID=UPI003B5B1D74